MPLHKLRDFDPNYREYFDNQEDILKYDLYSGNDKVGSIDDLLVDDDGRIRYFVINTGLWIFGKKVLLPVGRARVSREDHRIYVDGLTREQVEQMPAYDENSMVDNTHEDRVRSTYRPSGTTQAYGADLGAGATGATMGTNMVDTPTPLESDRTMVGQDNISGTDINRDINRTDIDRDITTPGYGTDVSMRDRDVTTPGYGVGSDVSMTDQDITTSNYDADVSMRDRYDYDRDNLYAMNDRDHQTLRLYEERLVANKQRVKTGEVIAGKRVETEQAHVSVPVERERVVIERGAPTDTGAISDAALGDAFGEGEVARIEVFEETPDVHKEAFVREEVRVRKEVDQDTVDVDDTIRREELDLRTDGNPVVNSPNEDRNLL